MCYSFTSCPMVNFLVGFLQAGVFNWNDMRPQVANSFLDHTFVPNFSSNHPQRTKDHFRKSKAVSSDRCYLGLLLPRTAVISDHCHLGPLLSRTTVASNCCYVGPLLPQAAVSLDRFYFGQLLARTTVCGLGDLDFFRRNQKAIAS